jgi:hypothetical protein
MPAKISRSRLIPRNAFRWLDWHGSGVGGPYKITRNPMYLGLASVYLGVAAADHEPRFRTFSDSLYARARVNVNLELSRSGNGVRNDFGDRMGVVADSSRNPLSTRSMWRATGTDGTGFAQDVVPAILLDHAAKLGSTNLQIIRAVSLR